MAKEMVLFFGGGIGFDGNMTQVLGRFGEESGQRFSYPYSSTSQNLAPSKLLLSNEYSIFGECSGTPHPKCLICYLVVRPAGWLLVGYLNVSTFSNLTSSQFISLGSYVSGFPWGVGKNDRLYMIQ